MYREIHEVAGLERRAAVKAYAMIATAAFESLPVSLFAPKDNLRPEEPLIAEALRRLDVDCVAAGMEALEALHAAASAAVKVAAAAAAAPLLAVLRRHVRMASATRERATMAHTSDADIGLVAALEERAAQRHSVSFGGALQRQSVSIGRALRRVQPIPPTEPIPVAEAARLPLGRIPGGTESDTYSSEDGAVTTLASEALSSDSAKELALESVISNASAVFGSAHSFVKQHQDRTHTMQNNCATLRPLTGVTSAATDNSSHHEPAEAGQQAFICSPHLPAAEISAGGCGATQHCAGHDQPGVTTTGSGTQQSPNSDDKVSVPATEASTSNVSEDQGGPIDEDVAGPTASVSTHLGEQVRWAGATAA